MLAIWVLANRKPKRRQGKVQLINAVLPTNEVIESAIRKSVPMYPELAGPF